jgi:hypothetical protein
MDTLNMALLNVRGLWHKHGLGILPEYFTNCILVGMVETLTDEFDIGECYDVAIKPRHSKKKPNGAVHGMCIVSNSRLVKRLDGQIKTSKYTLWQKYQVVGTDKQITVCLAYLPCQSSVHYNCNAFEYLLEELTHVTNIEDTPVVIMGDFNARTGTLDDVWREDDEPSVCRANRDEHVNKTGLQLIHFCHTTGFRIINGCSGNDTGVGEFTCQKCRGSSTVDYMLGNNMFCQLIKNFTVEKYDPCLSDVHSMLSCSLDIRPTPLSETTSQVRQPKVTWDNAQKKQLQG